MRKARAIPCPVRAAAKIEAFNGVSAQHLITELVAQGYGKKGLTEKLGITGETLNVLLPFVGIRALPRQKYPAVLRIERRFGKPLGEVLKQCADEGRGLRATCRHLKVSPSTLQRWCAQYGVSFTPDKPRGNSKYITLRGETHHVKGWAEKVGIAKNSMSRRISSSKLPLHVLLTVKDLPRVLRGHNYAVLAEIVCAEGQALAFGVTSLQERLRVMHGIELTQRQAATAAMALVHTGFARYVPHMRAWQATAKGRSWFYDLGEVIL